MPVKSQKTIGILALRGAFAEHAARLDRLGAAACFGTMDMKVKRNAYELQLGSFYDEKDFSGLEKISMTFIRAPYIVSVGPGVEILAEVDGHIAAARQGG